MIGHKAFPTGKDMRLGDGRESHFPGEEMEEIVVMPKRMWLVRNKDV